MATSHGKQTTAPSPSSSTGPVKPGTFPDHHHDHGTCVRLALEQAEKLCAARGVRLTDTRRQVFELVWQSHNPVGAYTVLERLSAGSRRAQPPTVYRALEFLLDQGLIHRIESLNAYIGCAAPDHEHHSQFLICRRCGAAAELMDHSIETAIGKGAHAAGFAIEHPTIELEGLCSRCRGTPDDHEPHQ